MTHDEALNLAKRFYYDWFREDEPTRLAASPERVIDALAQLIRDIENGEAD